MIKLSRDTKRKLQKLFSDKQHSLVEKMLAEECAENIISYSKSELERVRQGILKISNGNIERLKESIDWAKVDWRDILLTAGFADDPKTHKKWEPKER